MTRFITLLIACSLAFASSALAKRAEQQNPKNKKSKPVEKAQMAPKQHKAPNPQVQPTPPRNPQNYGAVVAGNKPAVKLKPATPPKPQSGPNGTRQNLTTLPPDNTVVRPNKHVVQPNTVPAVQSNKFKVDKTVKTFQPRHQNFQARVNPSVASVRFNQNFRIRNAENWRGAHYDVFRTYRPQWHDRSWWSSNHNHIVLIGGGWYYWNSGYWYPAWGYDDSAAYYPYDGPIYVGQTPRPFDQVVADVQSVLQEQGYYRGEVDGLVGPLTQEALTAYQSAQGLEPTAAIDQPTLESLGIT